MATALGVLDETERTVTVHDPSQANRLYNKRALGVPLSGNALRLNLVEASYALDVGALRLEPSAGVRTVGDLLAKAGPGAAGLAVTYLAYRDLRERGLVVRPAEAQDGEPSHGPGPDRNRGVTSGLYHLWARGNQPPAQPEATVLLTGERQAITWPSLAGVDQVALVDDDGDVTHYRVHMEQPAGDVAGRPAAPRSGPWKGELLGDRVLVVDQEATPALAAIHMGVGHGQGVLLSLSEAAYLQSLGQLAPVMAGAPVDVAGVAGRLQAHAPLTSPVYADLRSRGVLPRSGFKFGTHWRGYRTGPDESHAEWLIQCVDLEEPLAWPELSRAVRVAHGVKKQLLLAAVSPRDAAGETETTPSGMGGSPRYLALSWHRP